MSNTLHIPWEVKEKRVYTGEYQPDADFTKEYKAIHHNQTDDLFHIASKNFTPFTNKELENLVNKLSDLGFEFKRYNEFKGGAAQLIKLKAPDYVKQINGHELSGDFIIGNAHDGTSSLFISVTYTYYACMNRFRLPKAMSVRHSKNISKNVDNFVASIKKLKESHEKFMEDAESMTQIEIDKKVYDLAIRRFLEIEETDKALDEISTRKENIYKDILQCINEEIKIHGSTKWALFNGFTRYTTYYTKNFNEFKLNNSTLLTKNNKAWNIVRSTSGIIN